MEQPEERWGEETIKWVSRSGGPDGAWAWVWGPRTHRLYPVGRHFFFAYGILALVIIGIVAGLWWTDGWRKERRAARLPPLALQEVLQRPVRMVAFKRYGRQIVVATYDQSGEPKSFHVEFTGQTASEVEALLMSRAKREKDGPNPASHGTALPRRP